MHWLFLVLIVLPNGGNYGQEKLFDSEEECRAKLAEYEAKPRETPIAWLNFADCIEIRDK